MGRMQLPRLFQRTDEGSSFFGNFGIGVRAERVTELVRSTGATFPARVLFTTKSSRKLLYRCSY